MGRHAIDTSNQWVGGIRHSHIRHRIRQSALQFLFIFICIAALAACGGSSGGGGGSTAGGNVSALSLPDRIEMTQVDDTVGTSGLYRTSAFSTSAYSDAGTDYATQTKESWLDDGNEALQMVNDILGACQQTAYDQFVNQGPYKALVKPVGESQSAQTGNTTTSHCHVQIELVSHFNQFQRLSHNHSGGFTTEELV